MPFREGQMIRVGGPRGLHAVMVDRVGTGAVATKLGIRRGDWGWVTVQWRVRDGGTGLSRMWNDDGWRRLGTRVAVQWRVGDGGTGLSRMRNDDGWRQLGSGERGLRRVSDGGAESQLWIDEG